MYEELPGNAPEYDVEHVRPLAESPLAGKRILFLGSSITFGYGSLDTSFVDYIARRNGNTFVKEAVSGTCLTDDASDSYVSRLHTVDTNEKFDLFVCQLSANDFSKCKPRGQVEDREPTTVCGAVNHIVEYVRKTWGCPIVFYSVQCFGVEEYRETVDDLLQIAGLRHFDVIDLYNDAAFNQITDEQRALYMADGMHPTKAGYLLWWTPVIEPRLYAALRQPLPPTEAD